MRITRVYTRSGDSGTTGLVGGQRVPKDDPRIEAYGTVDELNAIVGLVRTFNPTDNDDVGRRIDTLLEQVQNDLFNVGSDLATRPEDRWPTMYRVGDVDVQRLESEIDSLNEDLEPLKEFILPGGGPVGAFLHQARTVCRRAERRVLTLMAVETEAGEGPMRYLNRLSDWLFVLGRWAAKMHGEPEFNWKNPNRS